MENRQSHVIVGAVTLLLVVALFAFVLWLARFTGETRNAYDIFFKQSVSGLAIGSAVNFSGVPVGQVRRIALMPDSPEFVRVRIEVGEDVPVLEGTTAALQGVGFTGVTQIQLEGAVRGAAPISAIGPYGVPVIPARASGFGELLESAPQVLERVSTLLARLNEVFDDQNRASIANILTSVDKTTAVIAADGPALSAAIRESEATLKAATRAADQLARASATADRLLSEDGQPAIAELRAAISEANKTLQRIDRLVASAEPGVATLSTQTVPQLNLLIQDLRATSQSLGALTSRLDEDALGTLTGGRKLPDYQPEKQQ